MSKTQTPTLAELRELRENVVQRNTAYMRTCEPSQIEHEADRSAWADSIIDALIAAHPDTEGEKRG